MPEPHLCLELDALRYSFPGTASSGEDREVLHGVSLAARRGEVTVIIGPNGAGKTTTLNCAQGFLTPSSGTIRLLGQNPHQASAQLRARVGVMLQDGGLPQSVKPIVLLRHLARLHKDPWQVDDLIQRLDLSSFLHTSIRRISGGQRQRIAVAAALMGNPEVVFLDEPSAGLDPQSRHLVHELVDELRRRGVGIILTTHLLEEAQKLADHVVILRRGIVVRDGSIAELTAEENATAAPDIFAESATALSQGQHDAATTGISTSSPPQALLRSLVFTSPRDLSAAEIAQLPQPLSVFPAAGFGTAFGTGTDRGYRFKVTGLASPAELHALTGWWLQLDVMPEDISYETKTLEDVFWEVSGG